MDITRSPGRTPTRSQLVRSNGFAFTVAVSDIESESLYEQTQSALGAINRQLASIGLDRRAIVSAIVYITDMDKKPEMNRAWDEWCDRDHAPMRACIGVALEGWHQVEIVVTAADKTGGA